MQDRLAQCLLPARANLHQIRIVRREPAVPRDLQFVGDVRQQSIGGPTVTFDFIVESIESSAYFAASSSVVLVVPDPAIEDRPAVLRLADLQDTASLPSPAAGCPADRS